MRQVRRVRRVRLGPPIQGCMACSIGFNTALATWHSLRLGPALAHLQSYRMDVKMAQMRQRHVVLTATLSMFSTFQPHALLLGCPKIVHRR